MKNWYVEWNGIFMPIGDSVGAGCMLAILMVVLWILGFLVYIIYKLISETIGAIGKGDWGGALARLFILAIPAILVTLVLSGQAVSAAAESVARQNRINEFVKCVLAEDVSPSFDGRMVQYTVINRCTETIIISPPMPFYLIGEEDQGGWYHEVQLEPGQSIKYENWPDQLKEECILVFQRTRPNDRWYLCPLNPEK